ncbi:MAG: ComF family protein [Chlorobi bacterium]|nr:ComF family protein [Chlorobiota bacterium]
MYFDYLTQFTRLFFPKNCEACGKNLLKSEIMLCTDCLYHIPKTKFHEEKDNVLNRLFYGITNITYATAFFYFHKASKYRTLIHKLKYKGQKEIGIQLGRMAGTEINGSFFDETNIIIPVPLHISKKRLRGYNQSEMIAKGLSEISGKELRTDILIRQKFTETQTKKNLEERRKNVSSAFKVIKPESLTGKHVLLIDDVVTTGSTLIACADEILKTKNVKVSVLVLGFAEQ